MPPLIPRYEMNIHDLSNALFEAQSNVSDADMTMADREVEVWMFDADICAIINELNEEICQLMEKVRLRRGKVRELEELRGQRLQEYGRNSAQLQEFKTQFFETSLALSFAYEAQRSTGDSDSRLQLHVTTDLHEQPGDRMETVVALDHEPASGLCMGAGLQAVVAKVECAAPAQQDVSESVQTLNQAVANVSNDIDIVAPEAPKNTNKRAHPDTPPMDPQPAGRPPPKQTKTSSIPRLRRAYSASKTDAAQARTSSSERARVPVAKGRRLMTPLEPGDGDSRLLICAQHIAQGAESAHRTNTQGLPTSTTLSPVSRRIAYQIQPELEGRGSALPVRVKPPFLRPNGQKYGP